MDNNNFENLENESKENEEKFALKVIESAIKLPFVKVNRTEFLAKHFPKNINKVIEEGPQSVFKKKELDKVADKVINAAVIKSSSLSFAAGLPGGLAVGATIPADMAQFYGYVLKLAQEIAYIYGHKDLFNENNELDEDARNKLILYLGAMLGVSAATSTVRVLSKQAANQASKTISQKALTKTFYYPILKKVLKTFGVKLTKDTFAKGISKTIPVLGGVVSGGMNFFSLKPMARKFKNQLSDSLNDDNSDYIHDLKIIEAEVKKSNSDDDSDDNTPVLV